MARFLLTIFLSAWLLFQLQPMMAKYILPWFGGGPAVWTACMLFFQSLLLGGYAYAHWSSTRLTPRRQAIAHLVLLAASLLLLPIGPQPEIWKPLASDLPTEHILVLLAANIGLPYLLLSSTSPLVQHWFHAAHPKRNPYPLYALSNAGSLLALLTYPFVVEPALALGSQFSIWSWSYGLFVVICGWCAVRFGWASNLPEHRVAPAGDHRSELSRANGTSLATTDAPDRSGHNAAHQVPAGTLLFWLALATCGSVLLLATTNQMSQEVPVIPFLWVLPLALYLLTFMLVFQSDRWYERRWYAIAVGVMVPIACGITVVGLGVELWIHALVDSLALLVCCMACHGELALAKPHPSRLTLYYLVIATGGALGGVFVAVIAPAVFTTYAEYPLGLGACCVLVAVGWYRAQAWYIYRARPYWVMGPLAGLSMGFLVSIVTWVSDRDPHILARFRNFYGVLRVQEQSDVNGPRRLLTHGRVTHGFQYLDPAMRDWPTSYFGPGSGIGLAMRFHPGRENGQRAQGLRLGVIGLGAGTIAAYARPGDILRFYEINPQVAEVADTFFTFEKDAPLKPDVILGDARVQLERELDEGHPQNYDILAVDAFSSGAIPTHLLTLECAQAYRRHLKPDGLLVFHISNHSVDLVPVVRGIANALDLQAILVETKADEHRGTSQSTWMILTHNEAFLSRPEVVAGSVHTTAPMRAAITWTDDFASVWPVLKY